MVTKLKQKKDEKQTLITELVLIQSILCFLDEFAERIQSRDL